MRTEVISEPGSPDLANEDFAAVAVPVSGQGGSLVVLDGVTPPREAYGCRHTVAWFTSRLGGALTELSVSRTDLPLPGVLAQAIARTASSHASTCDLSHPRTPQATVALARWSPQSVEYLVLSDAALLLQGVDGAVTAVLDDRLARLPRASLTSAAVTDTTLRNREGGFFTAAADPSVARRAVTGTLPRGRVHALAALTDGATRWVDRFRQGDWADCFWVVREEGAPELVRRVRALERADSARTHLGRAKRHDDATVVYVEP
ncbi:protein phosphatase 2C domain-containing protein [Streptomyces sp. CRN 30]|uniref:protein phosphatase 2C domain-containing protein n=1 Tax=Streptomyces sp. CRN 30 TaxID=3075613 RepID=UPI002A815AA8|nr:protein phosphatase 2C domain-containing protein [Streptomyces sp. CRN 30]